jgi:cytidine deaminase
MEPIDREMRDLLVKTALDARKHAYAPYSHYPVGAALLADSGRIYSGVNVENASFPTGICAEPVAVYKAVSEGERAFKAIAIVSLKGAAPCGFCRQVLSEFGQEILVIIANERGQIVKEATLSDLLPGAFSSSYLDSE